MEIKGLIPKKSKAPSDVQHQRVKRERGEKEKKINRQIGLGERFPVGRN